jgi:hypothetical protein
VNWRVPKLAAQPPSRADNAANETPSTERERKLGSGSILWNTLNGRKEELWIRLIGRSGLSDMF